MRTISLPFRFDGYGNVATTTSMNKILADRVRSVVSTNLGDRLMRPTYGTVTPVHVFGAADHMTSALDSDLSNALGAWVPEIRYTGMVVTPDPTRATVYVDVTYETPSATSEAGSALITIEAN